MSARRTVPVRILGREYRVRSDADEDIVRRAATLVDSTMRRIRDRTGTVDTLDLAVLTALNLANQAVSDRSDQGGPSSTVDGARVRALAELVESALEDGAPALA